MANDDDISDNNARTPEFSRRRTGNNNMSRMSVESSNDNASRGQSNRPAYGVLENHNGSAIQRYYSIVNSTVSLKQVLCLIIAFLLGFYLQLIVFWSRVKGPGSFRASWEYTSVVKPEFAPSLVTTMRHTLYVSNHTNWDFVGTQLAPSVEIYAHQLTTVPKPVSTTRSIIRHEGTDSYMNLHNKTFTLIHALGNDSHWLKQDDDAIVFWPLLYGCLSQCTSLSNCYAGNMHVNIGSLKNDNSYPFATGGSYFVGKDLMACLNNNPPFVENDGLDFGEDKSVGKMLHYNNCGAEIQSCKWFSNVIDSPNFNVTLRKTSSSILYISPDLD